MKMKMFWRRSVQKSMARFHDREKKAISSIPHESFDASLEKNVAELTRQLGANMDFVKVEKRDIAVPETEQSVIGPRESFVEDLNTNLTLIR
jgi:hypothetical protein